MNDEILVIYTSIIACDTVLCRGAYSYASLVYVYARLSDAPADTCQ